MYDSYGMCQEVKLKLDKQKLGSTNATVRVVLREELESNSPQQEYKSNSC